jgi:hypothetical protein
MSAKWTITAMVAVVAGGLGSCAVQQGYPYSATDCRYAAPLPRYWVPDGSERCEHFKPGVEPYRHYHHYHYRHYRHVKHPYHGGPTT